jgi:uncharacterized protein (TIGR02391 family)
MTCLAESPAIANLLGLLRGFLSMNSSPDLHPRESIRLTDLHPEVQQVATKLLRNGHLAQAIFEAFKLLERRVRQRTGIPLEGQKLMAEALDENDPYLSVATEPGRSGHDEQVGFKLILMGAMTGIRNPKAHEFVDQRDPIRTFEFLGFASLLLHRIDAAQVRRRDQPAQSHPSA